MTDLPAPLVPSYVDLTDFSFMPLHVQRLRDSDLVAMSSPVEFAAAVLLWCASWHQVPCGSLTNDDRVLSKYAGYGNVVKEWLKIKRGALRGFVLCSDGRLYHPVVAEQALEGWKAKVEQRWKTECGRIKKFNQRNQTQNPIPTLEQFTSLAQAQDVPRDMTVMSLGTDAACPEVVPGEKTSKGQGQGHKEDISGASTRPVDVIREFDAILHEVYGVEQSRPNPAANDHVYAQRFLDASADLEMITGTIKPIVQRFKAEGQRAPDNLKIFEKWIAGAIAAKHAPPAEARYGIGTRAKPAKPSIDDRYAELDRLCGDGPGAVESFGDPSGGPIIEQAAGGYRGTA